MEILEVVSQFIEVTVLRKTLSFLTNYLAFLAMESSLSPNDTIQHGSGNEATIDPPPVESNNEAAASVASSEFSTSLPADDQNSATSSVQKAPNPTSSTPANNSRGRLHGNSFVPTGFTFSGNRGRGRFVSARSMYQGDINRQHLKNINGFNATVQASDYNTNFPTMQNVSSATSLSRNSFGRTSFLPPAPNNQFSNSTNSQLYNAPSLNLSTQGTPAPLFDFRNAMAPPDFENSQSYNQSSNTTTSMEPNNTSDQHIRNSNTFIPIFNPSGKVFWNAKNVFNSQGRIGETQFRPGSLNRSNNITPSSSTEFLTNIPFTNSTGPLPQVSSGGGETDGQQVWNSPNFTVNQNIPNSANRTTNSYNSMISNGGNTVYPSELQARMQGITRNLLEVDQKSASLDRVRMADFDKLTDSNVSNFMQWKNKFELVLSLNGFSHVIQMDFEVGSKIVWPDSNSQAFKDCPPLLQLTLALCRAMENLDVKAVGKVMAIFMHVLSK